MQPTSGLQTQKCGSLGLSCSLLWSVQFVVNIIAWVTSAFSKCLEEYRQSEAEQGQSSHKTYSMDVPSKSVKSLPLHCKLLPWLSPLWRVAILAKLVPYCICCLPTAVVPHPLHFLALVPFLFLKPSLILCGFEEKVLQNAACQHNGIHFFSSGSGSFSGRSIIPKAPCTTFLTHDSL